MLKVENCSSYLDRVTTILTHVELHAEFDLAVDPALVARSFSLPLQHCLRNRMRKHRFSKINERNSH